MRVRGRKIYEIRFYHIGEFEKKYFFRFQNKILISWYDLYLFKR